MAKNMMTRRTVGLSTLALGMLLALQIGCASSGGGGAAPPSGAPTSVTEVSRTAVISAMDLREEGEVALLEIAADRPLVWTNYRDSHGNLVVELPNSRPDDDLRDLATEKGLVASVEIEWLDDAERPLTRLVVRTREDSEHSLTTEGDTLRLQLLPVGYEAPAVLAYEPVDRGRETPPPARTAARPPAPKSLGTADAPVRGPSPEGVGASRLYSVSAQNLGDRTVVQVIGDGEFSYSMFRLPNPERFVIDLEGVVNTSPESSVNVDSTHLDRIRVGQFKPRPDPVSRVVFDLKTSDPPRIERSADGLVVIFGTGAAPASESVVAEEAGAMPAGEPEEMAAEPSMMESEPMAGEMAAGEMAAGEMAAGEPEPAVEMAEMEEEPMAGEPAPGGTPPGGTSPPAPLFEPMPSAAPAPSSVAARQPPEEAGTPAEMPRMPSITRPVGQRDVSLFEAQEVDVSESLEDEERFFPSFTDIVVNRHQREYKGDPINMSLKNADLVETLRSFASISGLNFVIQPGVSGSVTVELKEVPWDQAMEQILRINNLGMDIDGTIVRIAPAAQLRAEAEEEKALAQARAATVQLRTVMRSLSYADAGQVSSLLRNRSGAILSDRGTVQVDRRTNTLILREVPSNINTVLAVIDNLDTPEAQVTIEARIIEATKTFSRALGIAWGYDTVADAAHGNTTGLQFPNNLVSDGGVGLLTGGATGFLNLTMGNILNTFNLNMRLQAAEVEGLINVISAPRVTTLNNSSASIQSGLQIPVQTVSNNTVSVQFVNATLQLTVRPHVTAEGTIILNINVAKRSPQLAFLVAGASSAPIATKEASTTVIVRDGGTAVIGGIYEVSSNQNQDRVPGLANIPVIGHLFKNRNKSEDNNELMIFVTPHIVQM